MAVLKHNPKIIWCSLRGEWGLFSLPLNLGGLMTAWSNRQCQKWCCVTSKAGSKKACIFTLCTGHQNSEPELAHRKVNMWKPPCSEEAQPRGEAEGECQLSQSSSLPASGTTHESEGALGRFQLPSVKSPLPQHWSLPREGVRNQGAETSYPWHALPNFLTHWIC